MIEWTWRCTPGSWSSDLGDALGGHDHAKLQAVIERVWRYTQRPWSSQLRDALPNRNQVSLEMDLEAMIVGTRRPWSSESRETLGAVIERVWRFTWEPWSSEFGDTLGGRDQARLKEYLEAVDGRHAGCRDSINQLVNLQPWECDKVTLPLGSHGELADGSRSCREARRKLKLHSGVYS